MKRICATWVLLLTSMVGRTQAGHAELPTIPATQPFSFAVFGDNRGDESGEQPPPFFQVLRAVEQTKPAFVLDTGDMIYGRSSDEVKVREEWRSYRQATEQLHAPLFHAPGNHDIWDNASARIYHELWGDSYYAFDYGNSRFIALDTETSRDRLGDEQFHWLERQLQNCTQTNVFLFFHGPLFPTDTGIGSSLDQFPAERDQLHRLFSRYRHLIRGVFAGHEHLYDFQQRDGVAYYISGGGGAPLYTAPELGGFHHFLLVQVKGNQATVQLKKVCATTNPLQTPRKVRLGEVLESWEQGLFWYGWDRSASIELTAARASQGRQGLRLNFDLTQYAWPVLVLPLGPAWDLEDCESLSLDVYVPQDLSGSFSLTAAAQGLTKHEALSVRLKPGWNRVVTKLEANWLPLNERRKVESLEWSLSDGSQSRGYVVFDNLRMDRRATNQAKQTELLESWERPLLWRVFDETVGGEIQGRRGLVLHADLGKCNRPVLFAQLNPPWDLRKVEALELQVEMPAGVPDDLAIGLVLRAREVAFRAPTQPLRRGSTDIKFALEPDWLPDDARAAAEQIAFRLVSTNRLGQADLRFKRLTAARNP